jgi:NAD(P)H-hydrate epimerase
VIPIVTPEEMAAIDAAAPEPVEELIERAGAAVAAVALRMLGGGYGHRVVVLAGKGNNGNDGRAAARRLERRGVRTLVVDAGDQPTAVPACDLVIDAAYGTGFRGELAAPAVAPGTPVLAVDIPSGVSGLTGEAGDGVLAADRTVTFAALKPGLVLEPGASLAGSIVVADIGLDTSSATVGVVTGDDVAAWFPARPVERHKWNAGVLLVAGSPGLSGAAHLVAAAAQRAGAGLVRLGSPGSDDPARPTEAVGLALPAIGWVDAVLAEVERFRALVVGPGLGRSEGTADEVVALLRRTSLPAVVDGDGLTALGADAASALDERAGPVVLTPHDGEFAALAGAAPGADRLGAVRSLAASTGAVVLLKGPTTVVADPHGEVRVVIEGDARLATAGTGDVLSGTIGALLAQGMPALEAAAAGAWLHARAANHGPAHGLVASDLVDLLPLALADGSAPDPGPSAEFGAQTARGRGWWRGRGPMCRSGRSGPTWRRCGNSPRRPSCARW